MHLTAGTRHGVCGISPSSPEKHKRCSHGFTASGVHTLNIYTANHVFLHDFSLSGYSLSIVIRKMKPFLDVPSETSGLVVHFSTTRHDKALSECVCPFLPTDVHHLEEATQNAFFGFPTNIWPEQDLQHMLV